MIPAAGFFVLAVLVMAGAWVLARAVWPRRGPVPAILLWQALGLAWGEAVIGGVLAVGLVPYHAGVAGGFAALVTELWSGRGLAVLTVGHLVVLGLGCGLAVLLSGALAVAAARVVRVRRRHRGLLELVAHADERAPGVLVLDHPAVVAYCLPGHVPGAGARVVVSQGTLGLLDDEQLAAVLAHERAHARARHDLVLLPFRALGLLLPARGPAGKAFAAVELLLEMCADDHAQRGLSWAHGAESERGDQGLATALLRFQAAYCSAVPAGALGAAETGPALRARRLLAPPPGLPVRARCGAYALTGVLLVLPAALSWLPGWPG
jgi:Zn-dependent protease with chaperone function